MSLSFDQAIETPWSHKLKIANDECKLANDKSFFHSLSALLFVGVLVHLVQLLLPVYDNDKRAFPRAYFDQVRHELAQQFGGVTAFVRSPAVGLWKDNEEDINRDDVIMFEVLTDNLDRRWWKSYREKLEKTFRQENILIRAIETTKL